MKFQALAVSFALLAHSSEALPSYRQRLPNGDRVPCPEGVSGCAERVEDYQPPLYCPGVGHATCAGGSVPINPFGEALKGAGHQWTVELCMADSDGDGATNGEELGDPCCTWSATQSDNSDMLALLRSAEVSHPGVDTSLPMVYKKYTECTPDEIGPIEDPEVESYFLPGEDQHVAEFVINDFEVPHGQITTYVDFAWKWEECAEVDCYITGIEAWADNTAMAHHNVISACVDEGTTDNGNVIVGSAMDSEGCETVGGWAPGKELVFRAPEEASQLLGRVRSLRVNFHYDNKLQVPGTRDSSGFRIYYTTTPRKYLMSGIKPIQLSVSPALRLPAGEKRYYITGECILEGLPEPVKLVNYGWHAHEVGTEMYDTITFTGQDPKLKSLVFQEPHWIFDDQATIDVLNKEYYLNNGDHIHMTCVYDTTSRVKQTIIGPETTDEMCWHGFNYYPYSPNMKCKVGNVWTGSLAAEESALEIPTVHPLSLAPALNVYPYVKDSSSTDPTLSGAELMASLKKPEVCFAEELNMEFETAEALQTALNIDMQGTDPVLMAKGLAMLVNVAGCACPSSTGFNELRPDLQEGMRSLSSNSKPMAKMIMERLGAYDGCDFSNDAEAPDSNDAEAPEAPVAADDPEAPGSLEDKDAPEDKGSIEDTNDTATTPDPPVKTPAPSSENPEYESSAPSAMLHLLYAGLLGPLAVFTFASSLCL
mmetsp:Transcript_19434/g.23247  ORF Transcript_19434/g.23247 Transcript_19434/m.23247 type:complete len:708 (+) Transcript_19434:142-2265(+)|eukprot:CAMPEP_0197858820 /NCGR_PEP_ID=MMETSP1438-20131217/32912_1 /TAXON_ID=1461541 /ORGANISM="Pterosperma sp., Strain CCMP1384" /LENGTH=707 /DNA_ID=CAMNT_0043475099 /DNA_START=137 /DNA_END=2260 /DNA_ORIENTATION=+